MNFLNNLKIKHKLLLLVIFPLVGLLYFSITSIANLYKTGTNVKQTSNLVKMSVNISALIHEIQKERGVTAIFLSSNGTKAKESLSIQRGLTNKVINNFLSFNNKLDYTPYKNDFKTKIEKANQLVNNISQIREDIINLKVSTAKAISVYTNDNTYFLSLISSCVKLNKIADVTKNLTAYDSFLHAKEKAGIERAIGAGALTKDKFANGSRAKFINLIDSQAQYLQTFKDYSDITELDFFNKTMQGNSIDEVNRIRAMLLKTEQKHIIIANIKELIGYRGMIHNFKNYVLRGKKSYKIKFRIQY